MFLSPSLLLPDILKNNISIAVLGHDLVLLGGPLFRPLVLDDLVVRAVPELDDVLSELLCKEESFHPCLDHLHLRHA